MHAGSDKHWQCQAARTAVTEATLVHGECGLLERRPWYIATQSPGDKTVEELVVFGYRVLADICSSSPEQMYDTGYISTGSAQGKLHGGVIQIPQLFMDLFEIPY